MLEFEERIRCLGSLHALARHGGDGSRASLYFQLGVPFVAILARHGETSGGAGYDAPLQRPAAIAGADAVLTEVEVSIGALGAEVVDDGLKFQPTCSFTWCYNTCMPRIGTRMKRSSH